MITEEIVSAPALVAGEWRRDGPWAHRTGPYLRRVVSRAAQASPADVARAAGYAQGTRRRRWPGWPRPPAPACLTGPHGSRRSGATVSPRCSPSLASRSPTAAGR